MRKSTAAIPEPLEHATQALVLDTLTRLGFLCWPHKNIPVPIRRGRAIVGLRKADPFLLGLPDIFVVQAGKLICIEMKRHRGGGGGDWKQQPEQKLWQERLERAGARYVLAYSLDEVLAALGCKPL